MRIPRFYIDITLTSGETISLTDDKAHHLTHVLRMRNGGLVTLFNGSGYEYESKVIDISKKSAQVEIGKEKKVDNESPLTINLCLAIARGQHMDFSIQKAVELGVSNITPILSEFSNVKLQESRVQNKLTHWQNIIISATEQCGRCRITQLHSPVGFYEWLEQDILTPRLILQPMSQKTMTGLNVSYSEITLIVGPEGGFSDHEINMAESSGCIGVSLGPRILRTETAVVSAVSNAQQLWGDLN